RWRGGAPFVVMRRVEVQHQGFATIGNHSPTEPTRNSTLSCLSVVRKHTRPVDVLLSAHPILNLLLMLTTELIGPATPVPSKLRIIEEVQLGNEQQHVLCCLMKRTMNYPRGSPGRRPPWSTPWSETHSAPTWRPQRGPRPGHVSAHAQTAKNPWR